MIPSSRRKYLHYNFFQSSPFERDHEKRLLELLENNAKLYPNKTAIIFGSESISYSQLLEKSNLLSQYLQDITKVGDVISLLSENSIHFVITYFAILKAGCIAHLISPQISDKQLVYQINKTKTKLILSSTIFFNIIYPLVSKSLFIFYQSNNLS